MKKVKISLTITLLVILASRNLYTMNRSQRHSKNIFTLQQYIKDNALNVGRVFYNHWDDQEMKEIRLFIGAPLCLIGAVGADKHRKILNPPLCCLLLGLLIVPLPPRP